MRLDAGTTSVRERKQQVDTDTRRVSSLASGGRPLRRLEVPNFAAIAWSLWLASQAYTSLDQSAQFPILNVVVYLFKSMMKIMSLDGVTNWNYVNSDSERFIGILWARLSFIGLDEALYKAHPLASVKDDVNLVPEGDQFVVYCIVRTLMQMQDYGIKGRSDDFPSNQFGRNRFLEENAGGGINKALYMLSKNPDRRLYSKARMKKAWIKNKDLVHLLYACEASNIKINALPKARFESMDEKLSCKIGEILSTCNLVARRLDSLDPVGTNRNT